ncbi:MAG: hypothetical protein KKD24_12755, partial [Proteobacteria bacterium]|nr:hypothetical protein [Pseudomonadota bacterium]
CQTFDDETGGKDCSRCPRSPLKIPIVIDTNVLISAIGQSLHQPCYRWRREDDHQRGFSPSVLLQ